jgi:hypothetical protein
MSGGANDGAYAGRGTYHAGGGGGGLHSSVTRFHDMLGAHAAELTPGVATIAAAIDTNATAIAASRLTNHLMVGLSPKDRPDLGWLQLMPSIPPQLASAISAISDGGDHRVRGPVNA